MGERVDAEEGGGYLRGGLRLVGWWEPGREARRVPGSVREIVLGNLGAT